MLNRGLPGAEVRTLDRYWAVAHEDRLVALIVHPLWSASHPELGRLHSLLGVVDLPCCNTFDAMRRPGWFFAQNRGEPRIGRWPAGVSDAGPPVPHEALQLAELQARLASRGRLSRPLYPPEPQRSLSRGSDS